MKAKYIYVYRENYNDIMKSVENKINAADLISRKIFESIFVSMMYISFLKNSHYFISRRTIRRLHH